MGCGRGNASKSLSLTRSVLADISPSDNGSDVITIERFLQLTTWKIRFGSYIEGEQ